MFPEMHVIFGWRYLYHFTFIIDYLVSRLIYIIYPFNVSYWVFRVSLSVHFECVLATEFQFAVVSLSAELL